MPPRKTSTKNARSSLRKTTTSRRATATQQPHSCDGCKADIPETEALNCSECGVWLHRYCAGIPNRHYATIATSFICVACSLTTSKSVILDLRGEIEALKAEVLELRTAMEEMKSNVKSQSSSGTDKQWTTVASGKRNATRNHRMIRNRPCQDAGQLHRMPPSGASGTVEKEKVPSVRRIWGTRKDTSTSMVVRILKQHTSVGNKVAIQRKSRIIFDNRQHWWYLVRSDESILEKLDSEWARVRSDTDSARWKLELCQRPKRSNPAVEHQPEEESPESEHMDNGEENDASAIQSNATTCPDGDPPAVDQAEAPFLGPPPN